MDPKRPLSEISHLFLSEMRARPGSTGRPARIPPPKSADVSIDMTPEEFSASMEAPNESATESPDVMPATMNDPARSPVISVVLSSHLMDQPSQSVRQYARSLAADSRNVGLIEIEGSELCLTCFEINGVEAPSPAVVESMDPRRITEILTEMAVDVERWIISLPNARTTEARELLREAPHWVMLTTADHEGVVATYRALKGLAELGQHRISLVVLDARDDSHAQAVYHKLDAVSRQFLHCALEAVSPLRHAQNVAEQAILHCGRCGDGNGSSDHWNAIRQFAAGAIAPGEQEIHQPLYQEQPQPMKLNTPEAARISVAGDSLPEVIDLPTDASERAILDAVVRQGGADGRWVLCPIHPPMCPEALLAVGRDQRLMLLAVAGRGLGQLLSIGQALRWMSENTELIRMALPQLAIEANAAPCVRVLVDHNDLSADVLQPLLQSGTVTIQAYRRIKWAGKTGLLLEAA
jgi:hypothetical protein